MAGITPPGHQRQTKEGAKKHPEQYYQDAYYLAYAATSPEVDSANPFGYQAAPSGERRVMSAGETYKIMAEEDFLELRRLADGTEGWTMRGEDKKTMQSVAGRPGTIYVWDRPPPDPSVTSFNMVKVFAVFEGLQPWILYDTLHDCVYRWEWDANMLEGYNVCNLDLHNDVGYYCGKSPSALVQNRDFCNQRAWRNVDGREFIIMNRSRPHPACPPKKNCTRGVSICSGYVVRAHGPGACSLTYVAQVDLKGSIPAWVINLVITGQVPKTIANMYRVALEYTQWKERSSHARHRPWVVPPQPWGQPQPDDTHGWLGHKLRQPLPERGPPAPQQWYDGVPAMAWYAEGGPLQRLRLLRSDSALSRRSVHSSAASAAAGAAFSCVEFETCVGSSEGESDTEDDAESASAPLWDPRGRTEAGQTKEAAEQNPERYYRDAYYMAYMAGAKRGRDKRNPFGYHFGVDGRYEVENAGQRFNIWVEEDFLELRELCDSTQGWTLRGADHKAMPSVANKEGTIFVWDRPPPDPSLTHYNILRTFTVVDDLEPWYLFETLHDPVYRWAWDTHMAGGWNVCNLDLHNDVGYFALKSYTRLVEPRDWCNQRAWRNIDGREFIIMNRSRPHPGCPERKGYTRANSICSGFLVRPHGARGCTLTYVAQCDLKGRIPAWVINKIVTTQLPQTIAMMAKVGREYRQWKEQSSCPRHRPWVVPPQGYSRQQHLRNELHDWVYANYPSLAPKGEPPTAPDSWYEGAPALEWYKPGMPLCPAKPRSRQASPAKPPTPLPPPPPQSTAPVEPSVGSLQAHREEKKCCGKCGCCSVQ